MSATARRLRRAAARSAALNGTKRLGCTCAPDIEMHGSTHARILHDDDCPMANGPRTIVIYAPPRGCER